MHSLDIAPVHDIAWLFCRSLWLPPRVNWRRRWTLAVSRKRVLAAGTNGSRPGSKQLFSALGRLTGKCLCSTDKSRLFTLPRSRCYSAFFFTAWFGPVSRTISEYFFLALQDMPKHPKKATNSCAMPCCAIFFQTAAQWRAPSKQPVSEPLRRASWDRKDSIRLNLILVMVKRLWSSTATECLRATVCALKYVSMWCGDAVLCGLSCDDIWLSDAWFCHLVSS